MRLLLVGLSHRTAPVELRERVDFQARGVADALAALAARGSTREAAIVSTCNRAELYVACDDVIRTRGDLMEFVSVFNDVPRSDVAPHLYDAADLEAARHLFRVAAGLESLVVGEPQILGQVKEAHTAATLSQTAGPVLNRLFHASFAVGKRVRTETGLGSGAVSISYAAVALARKIFGDLTGRNVLVIGAGEMGKLTALHMKSQGVQRVTIVSRTIAHAARTAEAIGGASAAPWEDLDSLLGASDIVITATGAAAPILTKARVESVMRPPRRRNHASDRREIAVDADRTAQSGRRRRVRQRLHRSADAAVRPRQLRRGAGERVQRPAVRPQQATVTWRASFDSERGAASSRCGRPAPSGRASPKPADPRAASWSSGRRAIGCSTRRCRRSAASGCSSRKSRTRCCAMRSISPFTAART